MDLQKFSFQNKSPIRCTNQSDTIWFVGKDIAKMLEYQNTAQAIRLQVEPEDKLSAKDLGVLLNSTLDKQTILINESGLYSLILSSKKPEAKIFERWITKEVIPSIRRTSLFSTKSNLDIVTEKKKI